MSDFIDDHIGWVIMLGVGVFVGIITILILIGIGSPNNGQHTGIVTSVEQTGIIFKTWTAYIKTSSQSTQEDAYCVTDPHVISQLKSDATSVKEVTVNYSRGIFMPITECNGEGSIINSVQ